MVQINPTGDFVWERELTYCVAQVTINIERSVHRELDESEN